jgi:hypothetical protein
VDSLREAAFAQLSPRIIELYYCLYPFAYESEVPLHDRNLFARDTGLCQDKLAKLNQRVSDERGIKPDEDDGSHSVFDETISTTLGSIIGFTNSLADLHLSHRLHCADIYHHQPFNPQEYSLRGPLQELSIIPQPSHNTRNAPPGPYLRFLRPTWAEKVSRHSSEVDEILKAFASSKSTRKNQEFKWCLRIYDILNEMTAATIEGKIGYDEAGWAEGRDIPMAYDDGTQHW